MFAPPAKKIKEPTTISMVVEEWDDDEYEQYSAVQRVNGYPWRLRLVTSHVTDKRSLLLICDKSTESILWQCALCASCTIKESSRSCRAGRSSGMMRFTSWDMQQHRVAEDDFPAGCRVEVQIMTNDDGDSWRRRPILAPLQFRDAILLIGEDKKPLQVHRESLASQSSFFDKLFFGDFKERNMTEIAIGDVEYEEFANLIMIVYGFDGASLTDDNVDKVRQLADRFDFKIVEDRVVSYLLSSSSSLSIHQRLMFAEQYNLAFLRDRLIDAYTIHQLQELSQSDEFRQLSMTTIQALFRKSCEIMFYRRIHMTPIGMGARS